MEQQTKLESTKSYINVLMTCDQWKSHSSASPVLTFSDEQEAETLDYIKAHLNAFFNGKKITLQ